jgi:hypothetical protein
MGRRTSTTRKGSRLERRKDQEKVTTGDFLSTKRTTRGPDRRASQAEKLGVSNLRIRNMDLLHLSSRLKHTLYKRDRHYVVQEGEILIVDDLGGDAGGVGPTDCTRRSRPKRASSRT